MSESLSTTYDSGLLAVGVDVGEHADVEHRDRPNRVKDLAHKTLMSKHTPMRASLYASTHMAVLIAST